MKNQLPLLMETVNPRFVREVAASVDPRLVAVLKRLSVWDRALGLYAEAELADLTPAEIANLPIDDRDLETLAVIARASTCSAARRHDARGFASQTASFSESRHPIL